MNSSAPSRRPQAIWYPLPVTEIFMAGGLLLLMVSLATGPATHGIELATGMGLMALGVFELTLREHLVGYRNHRAILAVLATIVVHLAAVQLAPFKLIGPGALGLDLGVLACAYGALGALWTRALSRRP